ncbi:MAG: thiamine pyrophosphate-binding protein [Deltaproteobacteria bacterium]|nr:thiamine pyrophosphate-binding protein [Deltaproteobacteria bacterium]
MQHDRIPAVSSVPGRHSRRNRDLPRRAADLLVDQLIAVGVDTVFGLPGAAVAPIYDALMDRPQVRMVTVKHEANAVFAAAGYAQTTGRLGVALVTSGPGALNAMNGLACAFSDGLPVLLLAGEAARDGFGRGAVQEGSVYALNLVGMAAKVSKLAFEVPEAAALPSMLRRAVGVAMTGKRGPVFVSLPLNVLGVAIPAPAVVFSATSESGLSQAPIEQALRALSGAGRKVLLAGAGTRFGHGPALLREVAERLQCPVMTTPKAKGVFPESHPLSLGVFGMGGHPSTTAYLEAGVETILVVGSSLNEVATDGWSPLLKGGRTLIHVDVDAARVGRVYETDLAIVAPAEIFFAQLLQLAPQAAAMSPCRILYDRDPQEVPDGVGPGIGAPRALWELQQVLPPDTIYTTDSGTNLFFAIHYLKIDHPDAFVCLMGLGSMGTAIGTAIGAQVGNPERSVVAVLGDGGLAMTAGELLTAAAYELPIVVAVLNNGGLGMVEYGQAAVYGRTPRFETAPMSVTDLARAVGCDGTTIDGPNQVAAVLKARRVRPMVLDVHLDPRATIPGNRRVDKVKKSARVAELN